jgi:hypothetical protein
MKTDRCLKCGRAGHCSASCRRPFTGQQGIATILLLKVLAVVAIAAGAVLLYQRHAEGLREEGRQEVRAENAARALEQLQADARETQRRLERQGDAQRENLAQLNRARADADAHAAARGRMSRQLADFVAAHRGRPGDSAPIGSRAPASAALDLLADLLSGADAASGILAEALDRSYAAGQLCERSYDALTLKP